MPPPRMTCAAWRSEPGINAEAYWQAPSRHASPSRGEGEIVRARVSLMEALPHRLVFGRNRRGVRLAFFGQPLGERGIGQRHDFPRQVGGIFCAGFADCDTGDRNTPWHHYGREQRVLSFQRTDI